MTTPTTTRGSRSGGQTSLPPVVEGLLLDMVADGFVLYCCGRRADPTALIASYDWEHFVDILTIRDFDRVTAARVPAPDRGRVDVLAPETVVWAYEGPGSFQDHMRLRILKDRSMERVAHRVVSVMSRLPIRWIAPTAR
ncbi:MAG: hypothetical protein ACRDTE_14985, partial [Pseudonocardiaceae bacterium]